MKVAVLTLGCRVNQSESSVLEGTLKENGIAIVSLKEKPDFCIVNTCTVTAKSDYNSRQLIRRAARAGAKVIVTGCYSELRSDQVNAIPGVVHIVENEGKYRIPALIKENISTPSFSYSGRSRPYLKIQDGCDFHCSYCSVPFARGRSKSTPIAEVLTRIQSIENRGFKEIVLTGIHLGTYGRDLEEKVSLTTLLRKILQETTIHRVRLSSLEVNEVDDELIELLQEKRLCKHLHLPLQSGCDKILKLMRRFYHADTYRRKIESLAVKIDNISLGTDIIIGFPGEEESDYSETYEFVRELPFSYLHVFPFSPREGTEAFAMSKSSRNISGRLNSMKELNEDKKMHYMAAQLNRKLEVIIEERTEDGVTRGTSSNYLKIAVHSRELSKGSIAIVRPEAIISGCLFGSLIT